MYTDLRKGSKKAVVVVRNNTAYSQTLQKKTPVAKEVAALPVPKPSEGEQLLKRDNEPHDPHTPRPTVRQRHGKLFDELDLSSLDSWSPELVDATCWLLAKYHDMFSLDATELGCTYSPEHTIKVTDDTPFKEWFRQIPPPLGEEVRSICGKCWNLVPSDQPECLVQYSGIGAEGQQFMVLYLLLLPECLHDKGLLPSA